MQFSTDNPIYFVIDFFMNTATLLNSKYFWGISILQWTFAFLFLSMAISVFWRGARG